MIKSVRNIFNVPEKCSSKFYIKYKILQIFGVNRGVPWPVHFTSQVICPEKVKLGKGTYPGDSPHCYIQAINGIEIGDYTNIAPGVGLISANHDLINNDKHINAPPIKIGKNCWIGMNAVILPGVNLGDRTIVGAGAVVTKSFETGNCVIAGNPAKIIRTI